MYSVRKFSPGPGFEPGSPALRDGALPTDIRGNILAWPRTSSGGSVIRAPARRGGDPDSNLRPGEHFSL